MRVNPMFIHSYGNLLDFHFFGGSGLLTFLHSAVAAPTLFLACLHVFKPVTIIDG